MAVAALGILLFNEGQRSGSLSPNNTTKQKLRTLADHCVWRSQPRPTTANTGDTELKCASSMALLPSDAILNMQKCHPVRPSLASGAGKQIAKPRCHETSSASDVLPERHCH